MGRKFEVGQRVAFYDSGKRHVGIIGKVGDDAGSENIRVDRVKSQQFEKWDFGWFHPKQIKRLVPRKRREFWIRPSVPPPGPLGSAFGCIGTMPEILTFKPPVPEDYIHVREIPAKKGGGK